MMRPSDGGRGIPARIIGVIMLLALGWTAWFFWRDPSSRRHGVEDRAANPASGDPSAWNPPNSERNPKPKKEIVLMPIAPIAATLNAPEGDVEADLATLEIVLREYRRQYQGNPTGENVEITAALMGDNPRGLGFMPKLGKHQVNAQGELIDRWGSPYFFHVESSTRMEIRSAGQDNRFYTEDDVISPPAAGG